MAKSKENEGLLNAVKFCVYPCDIKEKFISIPESELTTGSEELSVRFLVSTYGFKIQSSIEGIEKKEHFNPEMNSRIDLVKKGLMYKSLKTKIEYEVVSDEDQEGDFVVKSVNFGAKDKTMSKQMILDKIKSKDYILTQTVKA